MIQMGSQISSHLPPLLAELILRLLCAPPICCPSNVQARLASSAVAKSTKAEPLDLPWSSKSSLAFTGWRPWEANIDLMS